MVKKSEKHVKREEQTLLIGGEKVYVSPEAVQSTPSTATSEQVKKGLESILKKDIFPTPVTSG